MSAHSKKMLETFAAVARNAKLDVAAQAAVDVTSALFGISRADAMMALASATSVAARRIHGRTLTPVGFIDAVSTMAKDMLDIPDASGSSDKEPENQASGRASDEAVERQVDAVRQHCNVQTAFDLSSHLAKEIDRKNVSNADAALGAAHLVMRLGRTFPGGVEFGTQVISRIAQDLAGHHFTRTAGGKDDGYSSARLKELIRITPPEITREASKYAEQVVDLLAQGDEVAARKLMAEAGERMATLAKERIASSRLKPGETVLHELTSDDNVTEAAVAFVPPEGVTDAQVNACIREHVERLRFAISTLQPAPANNDGDNDAA